MDLIRADHGPNSQIENSNSQIRNPVLRLLVLLGGTGICVALIWMTLQLAYARLLVKYAMTFRSLTAANESLRFAPLDAEAHLARALLLKSLGQIAESVSALERATALRPGDYYAWLELGMARDENEDQTGALNALNEAVRLAPYYAQPRWQRGNLLLRMGRYDDAFVDLRLAARSNPSLLPNLLDLSWGLSKGDVSITEQLADVSSPQMRKDFALFLAAQGKAAAALGQLKLAGPIEPEIKEPIVARLLGKGAYAEAQEVWGAGTNIAPEAVYDGGFEAALRLDETQFGWRVQRNQPGVEVSLETAEVRSGEKSLHVELTGDSNFGIPIVSQLIVVKPATAYEISFAVRTRDVVTAARPLMTVDDATERTRLGESPSLPAGSSDWQLIKFPFTTGATTQAVILSLQKERCASGRCPAFGSAWLDEISISRK